MALADIFLMLIRCSRRHLGKGVTALLLLVYLMNRNNYTPDYVKVAMQNRSTQIVAVIGGILLLGALILFVWDLDNRIKAFFEHPTLPNEDLLDEDHRSNNPDANLGQPSQDQ